MNSMITLKSSHMLARKFSKLAHYLN